VKWYIAFIAVLLFGCQQPNNKTIAIKAQTHPDSIKIERIDSIRQKQKEEEIADSIAQKRTIDTILKYALQHKDQSSYVKKLTLFGDTALSAELTFGHPFSDNKKHLLVINKSNYVDTHINVFILENGKFCSVLNLTECSLNYLGFLVKDVNGDHFKDFLYNWYPSSGCCRRNIYDVYLYQNNNGSFTSKYKFINPTFSPAEKVIRGVNYGHPGEVPLYKYKWNGLTIDTIEYIYPADTLKKKFYLVHRYNDYRHPKKGKILSVVPSEYRNIMGYDWFMDY
jgi:hypothetical protein